MLNRKRFYYLLLFMQALAPAWAFSQTCNTQAGTIQPGAYQVCANELFVAPYNNDAQLEANDFQIFVLHNGTANTLGDIQYWNTTPEFGNIFISQNTSQTFQIACLAGDETFGWVDFNDPCLSMTGGATLTVIAAPFVYISTPPLLECGGSLPVTLVANAWPQGATYQYAWSGPVSAPASNAPQTSTPGTYTVTITNGVCSNTSSVSVYSPATYPIAINHDNFVCTPVGGQRLTVPINQSYPVSTYEWNTGETSSSIVIENEPQANYCVTVTFQQGCSVSVCDTPVNYIPIATIEFNQFDCIDSATLLTVNGNFWNGTSPQVAWTYEGAPYNSPWWGISDPEPGHYSVMVTTAGGCVATASYFLETSSDICSQISGTIYGDMNSSCDQDGGDITLPNVVLTIRNSAGNIVGYGYSDTNGAWTADLAAGTYTISATPPGAAWEVCPLTATVTLVETQTSTLDFFMQPEALCSDINVDISNSFIRRCFNTGFYVKYCNNGTATAEDAYLELELDDYLTIDTASIPYVAVAGSANTYQFSVGDVAPGECDDFWVEVTTSCEAQLGQSLCSKITAFPHSPCGQENQWSGASISITGTCEADSVRFAITNIGTNTMSIPLEYVVIEDAILMFQAPPPFITLEVQSSHEIAVPANGATWRVEAVQEPNHPGNSLPSLTIEGCTTGQVFSVGYFNQYPLDDADPWLDEDCSVVVGSYDPNKKEGFPLGYGSSHQIDRSTALEYTIHFQNTGTDTAFTVVIRDTLAAFLEPTSIRPGASSHPYTFDFYGEGANIKFQFDNINLPDSAKTQAGSQGFVSYRIAQKPGVPFGSVIENKAGIYFDFNEPIITNTTTHVVDTSFIITAAWHPVDPNLTLHIAPNPMDESATLFIKGLTPGLETRVEILDQTGRIIQYHQFTANACTLQKNNMPSGTYFIRVITQDNLMGVGKLMVR